jgi:putative ABC transport system permease protein
MYGLLVDLLLAQRNLRRQGRRSALALAAIASGVAALLLAGGFIEWNFWHYREAMINSQLGHIQIHRAGYVERGLADPFAFLLPERPALGSEQAARHVRGVAPRLSLSGMASHGDVTLPFLAEGVDPAAEGGLSEAVMVTAGRMLQVGDPESAIIGEGLAANLGVKIGDRIVLLANTRTGGLNAVEVTVRGVFATVSKAYDDVALRLPLATAQRLLRIAGAHTWMVLLDDTAATPAVLAELRSALPAEKYDVVPWWKLSDFYNKSAELFAKQVTVMKFIIGFLIVLSISNTLMMSVMERTAEIGTSMALGMKKAGVLRRFLAEGFLLGVVGAALGLAGGYALAAAISAIGIPVPPPPGMTHGYTGEILVTADLAVGAALLAVGTTLVASVYPAWKASRMVIVDALRESRA